MKYYDERPWVRLGAWEAYELIHKRLLDEKEADQIIGKADSLFESGEFSKAERHYQTTYEKLIGIIRVDSMAIGEVKLMQSRCTAIQKKVKSTLDNLEIAFRYNPALRDTMQNEMNRQEHDWMIIEDNRRFKEVLLRR